MERDEAANCGVGQCGRSNEVQSDGGESMATVEIGSRMAGERSVKVR